MARGRRSHEEALQRIAAAAVLLAKGDFSEPSSRSADPGDEAVFAALDAIRSSSARLVAETNRMSAEHEKGDIDVYIDTELFQGGFKTMATGVKRQRCDRAATSSSVWPRHLPVSTAACSW